MNASEVLFESSSIIKRMVHYITGLKAIVPGTKFGKRISVA